ncbi:toxin [Streptomyces cucumeris]|uniref:toxin n=1 Tax=Streptomyces cucumeris TaxID=2962890 RepID=UPI003D73B566
MCAPGCPTDGLMRRRHLKKLRRACRERLATLDIPALPDMAALCAFLGGRSGRPVHLLPVELHGTGVFGLWFRADDADYIAYERHTSTAHQWHIIAHEVSHMLCGHHGDGTTASIPTELFAGLDPSVVRGMLTRCGYAREVEQEAEVMASLLLLSLNARQQGGEPARRAAPGHRETLERIEDVIGPAGGGMVAPDVTRSRRGSG